jgi:hypothetical protein
METLKLYAKYFDDLQRLGGLPLDSSPTLDDMDLSRKSVQACYRDMKSLGFDGTIVDFLCWVSCQYILMEWEKGEKTIENFGNILERNQADKMNLIRLFCSKPKLIFDKWEKEMWVFVSLLRFQISN